MPDVKSKTQDLVDVTAAAHRFLRVLHVSQGHFHRLQEPNEKNATPGAYLHPTDCLIYFLELRSTAIALQKCFTERLRWELAGLASPRGLRVGTGTFASAHEVLAEAGRVALANLDFLLINRAFIDQVNEKFDWRLGRASVPEGAIARFIQHWQGKNSDFFLSLTWDIVQTIRFVRVPQLRGVLDCEHSLARRGRNVRFDHYGFPRSHLARLELPTDQASRFTDEISWSPSSRPNVVRFVTAAASLAETRSTKHPLSLTGIYKAANLVGNSQTRAKDAALRLSLVDSRWRLLPPGRRLLAEEA